MCGEAVEEVSVKKITLVYDNNIAYVYNFPPHYCSHTTLHCWVLSGAKLSKLHQHKLVRVHAHYGAVVYD